MAIPKNQSTPELVMNMAAVRRVEQELKKGAFARVSGRGDSVGITDGRLFMWFRLPQICGAIIRREYRIDMLETECAIHFKVLRACKLGEVARIYRQYARSEMYPLTRKRGHWYEVHGD